MYITYVYISWNRAFLDDRLIYPVQFSSRIYSLFRFYKTNVYLLLLIIHP